MSRSKSAGFTVPRRYCHTVGISGLSSDTHRSRAIRVAPSANTHHRHSSHSTSVCSVESVISLIARLSLVAQLADNIALRTKLAALMKQLDTADAGQFLPCRAADEPCSEDRVVGGACRGRTGPQLSGAHRSPCWTLTQLRRPLAVP